MGVDDQVRVKGDRAPVLRPEKEEAKHLSAVSSPELLIGFLQRVADRPEIVERLAHLFFCAVRGTDAKRTRVHPVVRELLSVRRFALRHFVLVMREDEVRTAAMNIEIFPEIVAAHG